MLKVSLGLCQVSRSPLLRFAFNDLDRSSRYSFHDLENQSIHRIPCELLGLEALIRVHQIPPLINVRYCLVRARNERNRIKFCRVTFKIASISISSSKISSLNQIRRSGSSKIIQTSLHTNRPYSYLDQEFGRKEDRWIRCAS